MPGFGRLKTTDPRDRNYPLRLRLPTQPEPIQTRIWPVAQVLNQGDTPQCVGYSWRQFLYTDPPGDADADPDPATIYRYAQAHDEWAGQPHDGSTIRAAATALSLLVPPLVVSYVWAGSVDDITQWLILHGPVVFGTNWYDQMMLPDNNSIVHVGGSVIGGHAYLCVGYDADRNLYRCCNSWGTGWGDAGLFWLPAHDVQRLVFDEGGEACTASEATPQPAPASAPGGTV